MLRETVSAFFFALAGIASAQTPRQAFAPEFEAVSVKAVEPGLRELYSMRGGPGTNEPSRIQFNRVTLVQLLMRAYDVWPDQVKGPDWIREREYNVAAVIPPGVSPEQFRVMLQRLLAERFRLRLHRESAEREAYELVLSGAEAKLRRWRPTNDEPAETDAGVFPDLGRDGWPALPAKARLPIGYLVPNPSGTVTRLAFRGSIPDLLTPLTAAVRLARGGIGDRPRVLDRTGLTGEYEIRLEFASVPPPNVTSPGDKDPSRAPSIFNALEQQLGLRLQKFDNVSVDVLVVDEANAIPAEN
jgi:uncharacterized protein (TIGR03435 family)